MIDQYRNDCGKFAKKGNSARAVRTIRLTDETWNLLGEKADENDMTRADYLEALASNEVDWNEEKDVESNLDFDIDEVTEIMKEILTFKSREGTKMKEKVKEIAEIMGIELEDE
jgi:hypothetical protein